MTEPIRLRVWLAGLGPIVVVLGLVLYFVLRPREHAPQHAASSAEPEPPAAVTAASPPPTAATVAGPSPRPPAPSAVAAASPPAPLDDPPEPVPEIDALFRRPSGSERWSPDERDAYRKKALADLDARERALQSEMAAARRAGDAVTEQRKRATLSYLRARRAEAERIMHIGHDTAREGAEGGSEAERKFGN